MNPVEIRKTCAELDGILNVNTACWRGHKNGYEVKIPDYLSDLNACAALEEVLLRHEGRMQFYYLWLGRICQGNPIRAKALLRCEAILRASGDWRDEK